MKRVFIAFAAACAFLVASSCQKNAEVEEVWIKNGDRNIYGVLSRPAGGPDSSLKNFRNPWIRSASFWSNPYSKI